MGYAIFTTPVFRTKKQLLPPKPLSPEVKARREFYRTHSFSFSTDPSTGEPIITATKIEEDAK